MIRLFLKLISLPAITFLVLAMAFSTNPAKAQSCNRLEAIECVKSSDCMYQRVGEAYQYECVNPPNRCQIGFVQGGARGGVNSGKDICESRPGCSFVPAGECYCPPDVDCVCGGGTPPNCAVDTGASLTPPDGHFVVVTIRNASDVAAPLDPSIRNEIIDTVFDFTPGGISTEGLDCESWAVKSVEKGINFHDPILADVMIGPMNSPISVGDKRILDHWSYSCEGEHLFTLTQIDQRVLVIIWNNSAQYLIAENPLELAAVERLQKELKTMKFYAGEISGKIDEATILSLGIWAEYRVQPKETYRFGRTAITENLLDALRVLTPN